MILQVKKNTITRGEATSTHHQALLVCALWHEVTKSSSSSESDSDDEMPSLNELVQQNLNYTKVCTSQQKKLKLLQEKLDSSQEAYKTLLE